MSSIDPIDPATGATPYQIDSLRDTAAAGADPNAGKQLWSALLGLPTWYVLDTAEAGKPLQPHCGQTENRWLMCVFTDSDRAAIFESDYRANLPQNAPPRVVAASPEETIKLAFSLAARGLFGLQFNPGPAGFSAPLGAVVPVWAECKSEDLAATARRFGIDEFDALASRAAATRKDEDLKAVLTRAAKLEWWVFLENPKTQGQPLFATLKDGKPTLMVFTAEQHAARAAFVSKINKPDGKVDMIKMKVPEAIDAMRKVPANANSVFVFNIASARFDLRADQLEWMLAQAR
jgi:hypothetical protein